LETQLSAIYMLAHCFREKEDNIVRRWVLEERVAKNL
jgi:hypothetical protein